MHLALFFYLPMSGNMKLHRESYCNWRKVGPDYVCNDLNANKYLWLFYSLCCLYFFISGVQIRHGLPEVLTSYFMIDRHHYIAKYIFLGFYNIPFIYEMRAIIDWTFARTSLDVYQWIKLA